MTITKNTKSVTDREIRNLKSGERLVDRDENTGLRIQRSAKGITSFFYRYRHPESKQIKQVKLGVYPTLSLAQARVKLSDLKLKRAIGIDPRTYLENKEKVIKNQLTMTSLSSFTVKDMTEIYLTQKIEGRFSKSGEYIEGSRVKKGQIETRRTLEVDVVKKIGCKCAANITRKDIVDLIMSIVERGAKVQAGCVLRELFLAYEYSISKDYFDENFINPAEKAKKALKQANIKLTHTKGKRALADDELAKFMNWLPESKLSFSIKGIFLLTLWTGCRTGELCVARWKDVDLERKILHLPKTKTGSQRDVQLPSQAVEYLLSIKLLTDDYIFPSQKTNKNITQSYLSSQTWHLRKKGLMLDIADWSPHDLRRTVRTGLARLRVSNEIAEAVLGHSSKGIVGTYNLHQYDDECREVLQMWADHLDKIVKY